MRIVGIVHVYYPELWPEISSCLRGIELRDLFITYSEDSVADLVRRDFPQAHFVKCANCGFDVWPFLSVINRLDLAAYDGVLKLHTKRDIGFACRLHGKNMSGSRWRTQLLSFVRGERSWIKTLKLLEQDPSVGMIGPVNCLLSRRSMGKSELRTYDQAVRLARKIYAPREKFNGARYVGGTMFLARPQIFRRLKGLYTESDFEEPRKVHGETFAHQLERFFGLCVVAEGFRATDPEDSIDTWRVQLDFFCYELLDWLKDFFFQCKVTARGHRLVKILKVPVWHSSLKEVGL